MSLIIQKIKLLPHFWPRLDELSKVAAACASRMLKNRAACSTKDYPELPSVLAKALVRKYQRNQECRNVTRLVLAVCGDKGKQLKLVEGGFRIPAFFKKQVIPVATWLHPINGFIRNVEFLCRKSEWFAHVCYATKCEEPIKPSGCIGVDRNSVGNVAVLADPHNGKVEHLGFNPAPTKYIWRHRKKNLQRRGKRRLLHRIRNKQSRRTKYENHKVAKQIVSYGQVHRRAIALEQLNAVRTDGSKIRRYTEKSQWSFAQLRQFITYKAALAGVPVVEVDPAFSSQDCSRCGSRHKPNGKSFVCKDCGHHDHKDANASFNLGVRGWKTICESSAGLSAPALGPDGLSQECSLLDGPHSGNRGHNNE
jgi:IS605 OrfB family transposase